MKTHLQKVNIEAERYQNQIQLLNDKQKEEQERRAQLLAEKNELNLKENKLKYDLQSYEREEARLQAEQQSLLTMVTRIFPEEIQEEIRREFERVKGLTTSQVMDDSELLYLQDSMVDSKNASRY